MSLHRFVIFGLLILAAGMAFAARQQLSEDRDLKELDLAHWDCMSKAEGTAKTPDGQERNRLKNRTMPEGGLPAAEQTDSAGFLKRIAQFEALTKGRKRKELNPQQKQALDPLEKQVVTMTGYLGLAYAGPPETTNCGSGDYHDWHLEVSEKPLEHPPQPGDPTPIICEITPRTQNAIFKDGIRIQELAGFFRRADLNYEPTGHKAQKVRITGYLLWDDEHNGTADVGTTIRTVGANKFHNPWRSIAWEIHPVLKIERADGLGAINPPANVPAATPDAAASAAAASNSPPAMSPAESIAPVATPPPPTATPEQKWVMITQPVRIKIPYGETTLARGVQLRMLSRDAQTISVEYMGNAYPIPIGYTDQH